MSQKRRDTKNRILKTGESQRKDGRYVYKYVDSFGNVKFEYSWRLVPTDKTPNGKRKSLSLREKEKIIWKNNDLGINSDCKKITTAGLYEKYIEQNTNVKPNTASGRNHLLNKLKKDMIGKKTIDKVKISDAKQWVVRWKEEGVSYSSIKNYKRSLRAAFQFAIQYDYIIKNPFDFDINDVVENDTNPAKPLSPEQQRLFLDFIKHDKLYCKNYDEIVILLGTGLRASELCGLTLADIDLNERKITIDHQLLKNTSCGYYIAPPKTKSSYRQIYMTNEVYKSFLRLTEKSKKSRPFFVGKYSGFIFLNQNGKPKTVASYDALFRRMVKKFKKHHSVKLSPGITPHTMRHTFCTNMANASMSPKALQYIMGHSTISMTLNYYTHIDFDSARTEMQRISS